MQILQKERKDQNQIQAPLYIEADLGEKQFEDQISTLYAVDEDELGIEGEEYVYDEEDAIHDGNEIDEYWKQFAESPEGLPLTRLFESLTKSFFDLYSFAFSG